MPTTRGRESDTRAAVKKKSVRLSLVYRKSVPLFSLGIFLTVTVSSDCCHARSAIPDRVCDARVRDGLEKWEGVVRQQRRNAGGPEKADEIGTT